MSEPIDSESQVTKPKSVEKTPADRPSHPDELPRFDVLKASRLEHDLGPAGVSRPADSGHEVQLLQKLLILQGCELAFSGKYDKGTFEAVRQLQRKHGLTITGRLDARTRSSFNHLLAEAQDHEAEVRRLWYLVYPYRKQQGLPVEGEWALVIQAWLTDLLSEIARPAPDRDQSPPGLQRPERPMLETLLGPLGQQGLTHLGTEVTRLQETLQGLGYAVQVSHNFDLQTTHALQQFQAEQGLFAHGISDEPTRNRLNPHLHRRYEREKAWEGLMRAIRDYQQRYALCTGPDLEARILADLLQLLTEAVLPIRCQLGPAIRTDVQTVGPDVLLLKCFLIQQGHKLAADLAFDSATAQALRELQKEYKLPRSGYVDQATLDLLNQLRNLPGALPTGTYARLYDELIS